MEKRETGKAEEIPENEKMVVSLKEELVPDRFAKI